MWIAEKIKNNIGTWLILIFILVCVFFNYFGNKKYSKDRLADYKSNYTGVIVKKYRQKGGAIIFYKDLKTSENFQINPADELVKNCNIGDTIIKLSKSNNCILKNGRKKIKVECYYVE